MGRESLARFHMILLDNNCEPHMFDTVYACSELIEQEESVNVRIITHLIIV
jgi:hypothetical protein